MRVERGEVVWEPPVDAWKHSQMADFARSARVDGAPPGEDYAALLAWSIASPDAFWRSLSGWAEVAWHDRPRCGLADAAMPGAVWFPGGTLNYAEHALRPWLDAPSGEAVVSVSQTRARRSLDGATLIDQVGRCREGLRRLGVTRGDRVVAYAPNIDETLVAFLATSSLGAVWSSCAPEFGVRAVTDRWSQIEPKVLVAVDGYRYGDRVIDRGTHLDEVVAALPSLEAVVRIPYLDPHGSGDWRTLLAEPSAVEFEAVPFDHPLYVLFSSGTTGLPKPIVHGHGGIVLEHLKTLRLHYDLAAGDRFSWFTTTGWMMWNLVVSGLLAGATTVLFDGDPASPDLDTLWRLAADEHLTVFGVSAPFVMASRKAGLQPGVAHDLTALRHLGSTGAPLPPEGFRWVRDAVGSQVQTGSLSGGTDVCTGFVGPAPTLPVRAGEITTRMLGCDVQAFTPAGDRCAPAETGELVITTPMPSMPVGFWDDPNGARFRAAYFAEFPGVWHHGDWITFHDDGACVISGRSDATLNRGGVRLGTSDFYTVVEGLDAVTDSLVVHLDDTEGGLGELLLFVACPPGVELDDATSDEIVRRLRAELSPRHVPDTIAQLRAIPRTLSGKKLEVPVKRMLQGEPAESVASRDSLVDPTAIDDVAAWIAQRPCGQAQRGANMCSCRDPG